MALTPTFLAAVAATQDDVDTFSFVKPAVLSGDVLVLVCGFTVNPGPVVITDASSSAWVQPLSREGASLGDNVLVASREVDDTEGSTITVVFDSPLGGVGTSPLVVCLAYRNIRPLTLEHPFSAVDVTASVSFPCPAQALGTGDLYLGIAHDNLLGNGTTSVPGNTRYNDGPANSTLWIFDLTPAVGAQTVTAQFASSGTALSLVLHPADDPAPYTRMMINLLPPGKVWRLIPGASTLYALLDGLAVSLTRLDRRARDLLVESHPPTAFELLPEYEAELDLDEAATTAERRARIEARTIARQRYRPVDFQNALAPLLGQDAVDVVVIETSHAEAVAMGDVREIFRFYIYRDPGEPGTYYLDSAQELVDQIKPSHTAGHVIESIDFLCDSPADLCDRDILGA
jgi:hypothetical protein